MASNRDIRAINALWQARKITDRQRDLLIGLETFTCGEGGWRKAGADLLAEAAGRSPDTMARARDELMAAGLLDYRRGNGQGNVSVYRITVPGVTDHDPEGPQPGADPEGPTWCRPS